jgi:hypothetical protein
MPAGMLVAGGPIFQHAPGTCNFANRLVTLVGYSNQP